MLTMLLFIALIIAGPEVLFVRQLSAYFTVHHAGFICNWASFFCLPALKSSCSWVLQLVLFVCFIKNQKPYPKDNTVKKFRFATSTSAMCMKTRLWLSSLKNGCWLDFIQELNTPNGLLFSNGAGCQLSTPPPVGKNWSLWQSILFTLSHLHHRYTQWLLCFWCGPWSNQNGQSYNLVSTYSPSSTATASPLSLELRWKHQPFWKFAPPKRPSFGEFKWYTGRMKFPPVSWNHPPAQLEKDVIPASFAPLTTSFMQKPSACSPQRPHVVEKRQNWHLRSLPAKSGSCQIGSQVLLMDSRFLSQYIQRSICSKAVCTASTQDRSFVVEQIVLYQDLDGKDPFCIWVWIWGSDWSLLSHPASDLFLQGYASMEGNHHH